MHVCVMGVRTLIYLQLASSSIITKRGSNYALWVEIKVAYFTEGMREYIVARFCYMEVGE